MSRRLHQAFAEPAIDWLPYLAALTLGVVAACLILAAVLLLL